MEWAGNLTREQLAAVTAPQGPVLILAGAGSGKTRVLTYRIAYLIKEKKVPPPEILALTFTNKAAGEMRERILALCQRDDFYHLGTFHSFCAKLLRQEIKYLNYSSNFVIYGENEQSELLKGVLKKLNLSELRYPPKLVRERISYFKNHLIIEDLGGEFKQIVSAYQAALRQNQALDFDDLLLLVLKLWEKFPERLKAARQRFPYLLVDEYQDVNPAQYRLLKQLSEPRHNLTVVGDDDQSIYSFRGADIGIILKFEQDFPEAKVYKLEENFRSTSSIVALANQLVSRNKGRKAKFLYTLKSGGELPALFESADARDEANLVVRKIKELSQKSGIKFGEMAVLMRTNAQSRSLEEALISQGIPYRVYAGVRFYERKEIKDLLSWLYFLVNPSDWISFLRIAQNFLPGLGVKSLAELNFKLGEAGKAGEGSEGEGNLNLLTFLEKPLNLAEFTPKARQSLSKFASQVREYQKVLGSISLRELLSRILEQSGYLADLDAHKTAEALQRRENLEELLGIAAEYEQENPGGDPAGFLARTALYSEIDSFKQEEGLVNLLTLHAAKGLEFPVVFLVGMEEGLLPHIKALDSPRDLEEERRLCYVGITRAKEKLYLSYAENRSLGGKALPRRISRFLEEVPFELFQRVDSLTVKRKRRFRFGGVSRKVSPFRVGEKVSHHIFGAGEVISISGSRAKVVFKQCGEKILDPEFLKAPEDEGEGVGERGAKLDFAQGERVWHKSLGSGILKRISGEEAEVIFVDQGLKKVSLEELEKAKANLPLKPNRLL